MHLKTLEICVLKYMSLILQKIFSSLLSQASLKRTKEKLDLLTDIDMLLMVVKGIRGGICHAIYQYEKLITNK